MRVARAELAAALTATIREAIDGYKAHLREKGDRQITIDLTERHLLLFFPDPSRALMDLTPARMQRLYDAARTRTTRRGGPPADATHQQTLLQAQALLAWACAKGIYRGEDPAKGIAPVGKRRRGKPQLRIDEARKWLQVALREAKTQPGALGAAVALLMGLRAGEVVSRTVRDLDDDGHVLHVDGKTGPRQVGVPEILRPLLLAACAGKLPGARIVERGPDVVAHWARRLCEMAEIPIPTKDDQRLCAHSLRGLHATLGLQEGQTAHVVAASLGNSPRVLRQSYAQPGAEAVAAARRAQMRLVK